MPENRVDPVELIVKSKVRVLLAEAEMRASEEIWNELGHTVSRKVKEAIRRARANGRKTVKAADF
jgi:histone H3/H4